MTISTLGLRSARQSALAAVLLATAAVAAGCAAGPIPALSIRGPESAAPPSAPRHFRVERNGLSKKVAFQDLDGPRRIEMRYKGIPVSRDSAIDLLVPNRIYQKQIHRVLYRFTEPLSARPMRLLARSWSETVATVPVRDPASGPEVLLFAGAEERPRGSLRYDFASRVLFSGRIEERQVEIERTSADTLPDRGPLRYFLFPFPPAGEFVVRVDGRPAARFTQERQRGFKSPYDLRLEGDTDPAARDAAMLAFVVFDLMKDFVQGTAG